MKTNVENRGTAQCEDDLNNIGSPTQAAAPISRTQIYQVSKTGANGPPAPRTDKGNVILVSDNRKQPEIKQGSQTPGRVVVQNRAARTSNDLTEARSRQLQIGGHSYTNSRVPETSKYATGVNFNVNMFNSTMAAPAGSKFGHDLKLHP